MFSKPKKIEILKIFNNNTQAKTAVKIACDIYREKPEESTVIVFGDENLLKPSLSALPEKLPWNVTMGYPLKNTLLAGFLRLYFELHESLSRKGFPYRQIKEFSMVIFVKRIFKKTNSRSYSLIQKNLNYIRAHELCKNDKTGALFYTPFKNSKQFLKQIENIIKIVRNSFIAEEDEPYHIQVCNIFLGFFEKLNKYCQDYNFIKSVSDIRMVFETMLSEEMLNFDGDPLNGIQIMGLLETRLLDFDNVVITNLNEGILPKGENSFSFFPFDVRKKFEMNTFLEKDHLYSYYFFRLLQRAKKIFLLYNASSEDFISSEPSRFLMQLEYFKEPNHKLKQKKIQLPLPEQRTKNKMVEKTEKILIDLKKIGKDGFSPSSLCQYIRDPYSFYEKRVLKIPELKESIKYLSAIDKGVIVHQVLEDLYSPYLAMVMKTNYYDEMLETIPKKLDDKFNLITINKNIRTGKNALIYSVIRKIISKFILSERNLVQNGLKLKILALEYEFKKTIYINSLGENQNFKGTVDRIDLVDGVLRFVDYKTGNLSSTDMTLGKWEDLTKNVKKNALFQVLSYSYFLKDDFNCDKVIAGVIPLRTFKNDFIPASEKNNSREKNILEIKSSTLNNFEEELFNLILEIYDPLIPILQKSV
ncbi:PD-(D/E)XK nuclease family protein [bacterium]|nr:PD-(D/E)XK nuclease family protein [bacterium]